MALTPVMFVIVLPMCFLAAAIDSISGGGGLISLPGYTLAGLDYDLASGTNKFSAMFGTLTATIRYARSGKVLFIPAIIAAAGALPGSYLGTRLAIYIGKEKMMIVMLCLLPIVAAVGMIRRPIGTQRKVLTKPRLALCFLIGLVTGAYDGFFGPGTGTFLMLGFTWAVGMDMVTASGTAKPVNLASNFASFLTRLANGQVIFLLAIPATAMSIAGGYVGARLAVRRGAKFVKFVMLGVLVLLMITIAIDLIETF